MKKIWSFIAGVALAATASGANAALIHFNGTIDYHNDVVYTYFTLDHDATDVRIWTDSYMNGENFDPIATLWAGDGTWLDELDDNSSVNPSTQTARDSGFFLDSLAAGDYIFTVSTYSNFSWSYELSDGFLFDYEAPEPMAEWEQPFNGFAMGPAWSVWLDGIDSASNPDDPEEPVVSVPEPGSLALIGLGLLGLALSRKHKSDKV